MVVRKEMTKDHKNHLILPGSRIQKRRVIREKVLIR
jgi:hypothetical protein